MSDEQLAVSGHSGMPGKAMWAATAVGAITLIAIITYAILFSTTMEKTINSFDECVEAGGAVGESYPEQCFIDGKSYANSKSATKVEREGYVGMSEQGAMDKAQREGVPSRVVERDGQPLPVTMDLVQGRLNFHVKDGKVYSVYVESL